MKKLCDRRIFLSSTINNLKAERASVQKRQEEPFDYVKFYAISSDQPKTLHMSGDDLRTYVGYNPNLFILNQIKFADYYLLILNDNYYGVRNIWDLWGRKKRGFL